MPIKEEKIKTMSSSENERQSRIDKIYEGEHFEPLFDQTYFVSSHGRLLVSDRVIKNRHWTTSFHEWHYYEYKKSLGKWAPKVSITVEGKRKMIPISRLVAKAFLGLDLDDKKTFVCHKDDNVNNNHVDNLFLWTNEDNLRDMATKMRWATRKLDRDQVNEIRSKYVPKKYTIRDLAKEYWISYFTTYAIIKWISWKK